MLDWFVGGVKKLIFRIGGGTEPSYKMYFDIDSNACVKYWKDHYGISLDRYMSLPGCYNRQLHVNFDCHGDPMVPTTDRPFGDLIDFYFPDAAWAQGKWQLIETKHTKHETGILIPNTNEYDIAANCCPPEWMNDIMGDEEGPD